MADAPTPPLTTPPSPIALAQNLRARRPAIGCFVDLPTVMTADIIGRAGFDFALIDMEHGPIGAETALAQIAVLAGCGVASIVRPPVATHPWVMRALDLGAAGVMAPNVASPEAAAELVRAARYGGGRGVATSVIRAAAYGADMDYEAAWNAAGFVVAQIEGPAALDAAHEIAAVDGVDVLFFGPADFAAAADYPGAAAVSRAFDRMIAAAARAGKRSGSVLFGDVDASAMRARGADFFTCASDVGILRDGARAAVAAARAGGDLF